jgi:hypothetical protein
MLMNKAKTSPDKSGPFDLTSPEILILNSAVHGLFPIDRFFLTEKNYRLCFGEPWHGLEPAACWLAIHGLIGKGLLEILRKRWVGQAGQERVFLAATARGGERWEQVCGVRWDRCLRFEAVREGGAASRFVVTAVDEDVLRQMAGRVRESEHAHLIRVSDVERGKGWTWSDWKKFPSAYRLAICVAKVDPEFCFLGALDFLFGLRDDIVAGFKTVPALSSS